MRRSRSTPGVAGRTRPPSTAPEKRGGVPERTEKARLARSKNESLPSSARGRQVHTIPSAKARSQSTSKLNQMTDRTDAILQDLQRLFLDHSSQESTPNKRSPKKSMVSTKTETAKVARRELSPTTSKGKPLSQEVRVVAAAVSPTESTQIKSESPEALMSGSPSCVTPENGHTNDPTSESPSSAKRELSFGSSNSVTVHQSTDTFQPKATTKQSLLERSSTHGQGVLQVGADSSTLEFTVMENQATQLAKLEAEVQEIEARLRATPLGSYYLGNDSGPRPIIPDVGPLFDSDQEREPSRSEWFAEAVTVAQSFTADNKSEPQLVPPRKEEKGEGNTALFESAIRATTIGYFAAKPETPDSPLSSKDDTSRVSAPASEPESLGPTAAKFTAASSATHTYPIICPTTPNNRPRITTAAELCSSPKIQIPSNMPKIGGLRKSREGPRPRTSPVTSSGGAKSTSLTASTESKVGASMSLSDAKVTVQTSKPVLMSSGADRAAKSQSASSSRGSLASKPVWMPTSRGKVDDVRSEPRATTPRIRSHSNPIKGNPVSERVPHRTETQRVGPREGWRDAREESKLWQVVTDLNAKLEESHNDKQKLQESNLQCQQKLAKVEGELADVKGSQDQLQKQFRTFCDQVMLQLGLLHTHMQQQQSPLQHSHQSHADHSSQQSVVPPQQLSSMSSPPAPSQYLPFPEYPTSQSPLSQSPSSQPLSPPIKPCPMNPLEPLLDSPPSPKPMHSTSGISKGHSFYPDGEPSPPIAVLNISHPSSLHANVSSHPTHPDLSSHPTNHSTPPVSTARPVAPAIVTHTHTPIPSRSTPRPATPVTLQPTNTSSVHEKDDFPTRSCDRTLNSPSTSVIEPTEFDSPRSQKLESRDHSRVGSSCGVSEEHEDSLNSEGSLSVTKPSEPHADLNPHDMQKTTGVSHCNTLKHFTQLMKHPPTPMLPWESLYDSTANLTPPKIHPSSGEH